MASPLRVREQRRYVAPAPRPKLVVVPRQRTFVKVASFMVAAGALIMVGSLTLHTRIAERQLAIDNLESSLNASQAEFEVLRSQRAELRSPTRIALESGALGMIPGTAGDFVDVDPLLVAITIARTGELPAQGATSNGFASAVEPLDQFRAVKALGAEAP